jgi:hypothetical protein
VTFGVPAPPSQQKMITDRPTGPLKMDALPRSGEGIHRVCGDTSAEPADPFPRPTVGLAVPLALPSTVGFDAELGHVVQTTGLETTWCKSVSPAIA